MKRESDEREMWQEWRRREIYTEFREENLTEGGHLEDLIADGMLLLKYLNYDGGGVHDLSRSGKGQVARCY
jgi:hypothetical protein